MLQMWIGGSYGDWVENPTVFRQREEATAQSATGKTHACSYEVGDWFADSVREAGLEQQMLNIEDGLEM